MECERHCAPNAIKLQSHSSVGMSHRVPWMRARKIKSQSKANDCERNLIHLSFAIMAIAFRIRPSLELSAANRALIPHIERIRIPIPTHIYIFILVPTLGISFEFASENPNGPRPRFRSIITIHLLAPIKRRPPEAQPPRQVIRSGVEARASA